jgi:hypothetical protein
MISHKTVNVYEQLLRVNTAITYVRKSKNDLLWQYGGIYYDEAVERLVGTNLVQFVQGWIYTGRINRRPEYVHKAYKYIKDISEKICLSRDGIFGEGPSYTATYYITLGHVFESVLTGVRVIRRAL